MAPTPAQPPFAPGDPVPWFQARASSNPRFNLGAAAGRHVVLCFFGSAGREPHRQILTSILETRELFDDERASFFGVSVDPGDEREQRVAQRLPGIRLFWDFDGRISRAYGALAPTTEDGQVRALYQPFILLLDPLLRVEATIAFSHEAPARLRAILGARSRDEDARDYRHAPVLILPRVFEPEFCRRLIELYEHQGGVESGFMRDVEGKTVVIVDHKIKRRSDCEIDDAVVRAEIQRLVNRRLTPEIEKVFQFKATRIERYIVACYDAATGGYFNAHRDNTTKGTAHRQFAVTINLNAEEYAGGDLRFPEFGPRTYRAPTGGAVVFSCSLLHEATPMLSGRRYAFLPFLYDDRRAHLRRENEKFLEAAPSNASVGLAEAEDSAEQIVASSEAQA